MDVKGVSEVAKLIKDFKDTLILANNELKNLLEEGVYGYLENQTRKYYFTNTFLHRGDKVKFDEIYYPVKLTYKELTTSFEYIHSIFDEYKYITVVGSAGSGKSTFIKYLFLNSIRQSFKIPILIELRQLNGTDLSISEFIHEKVLKQKIKPSEQIVERSLKQGAYLFLLDGYDEIFSENKENTIHQLEEFIDLYPDNNYVISTRPGGGVENFQRFYDFRVEDFTNTDIENFIEKLVDDKERKTEINKTISSNLEDGYRDYLKNPLLLSMFILAFGDHPEIPKKKSAFYHNVFDTLHSRHDGVTKSGWPREKKTKLQREDFEKILSVLSYLTLSEGNYDFTEELLSEKLLLIKNKYPEYDYAVEDLIYDLRTTISILIKDGFEYKFPHRSLQEYFAALFVKRLPTEEKKEKVYKALAINLENNSRDRSFNFWDLCEEMDYISFIKFFKIIKLKEFSKAIENSKDDNILLDKFYKLWEPSFFKDQDDRYFAIFRTQNFFSVFIDFYEIYNYRDFCGFIGNKNINTEFEALLLKELDLESLPKNHEMYQKFQEAPYKPAIKKFLIEHGISEVVRSYKKKLDDKVEFHEAELAKLDQNLDDILDF